MEQDNPGVIAPPPILYAGTILVGLALDAAVPLRTGLPPVPRLLVALTLGLIGAGLFVAATTRFARVGTNVRPSRPATTIVHDGVYGLTRNPIYVGFTCAYLSIALTADSVAMLVLLAPLLAVMDRLVIAREERYLAAKFGDAYAAYRARVRRWI